MQPENSLPKTYRSPTLDRPAKVYLIGAGPGDPGLLTVKGREVLGRADAIVYDNLVNLRLLRLARPGAELIYAGKRAGQHSASQEAINALLVRLAQEGKQVARLKGGDPFVFGRGGEEAQALRVAGIEYEVVPGISSAVAAAAYAGIPVTHREYTSSFTVITGHEDPNRPAEESRLDWQGMVRAGGTLVFLMGVGRLAEISTRLVEAGMPPTTRAAVVEWGTTWQQKTVSGPLSDLAELVKEAGIKPPALTIVGEVAGLREELQWFDLAEARPLLGQRIGLSHAGEAPDATAAKLAELGAQVVEFPVYRVVAPASYEPLDKAIARLAEFDWLLFSNATEVECFWQRLRLARRDTRALARLRVGATAKAAVALEEHGLLPDLILQKETAEELGPVKGQKILIPHAEETYKPLAATLESQGAKVEQVAAYRLEAGEDLLPGGASAAEMAGWLEAGQINKVIFTSERSLLDFAACLRAANAQPLAEMLSSCEIIVSDHVTEATARNLGLVTHRLELAGDLNEAISGYFSASEAEVATLALVS
jgi:uroporphyrinogen III methyltransferase/synthase